MRRLGVLFLLGVVSCAGQAATAPSPASEPVAVGPGQLSPYYGSYADGTGDIVVIARLGWFFDMSSSAYRTIYATATPNHFTIGGRFLQPVPKFADLVFGPGTLTIHEQRRVTTAKRLAYRSTDVTIPALGAQLAGTITEPLGPGPHPGIVIVHGAERGERHFYDVWVGVYAGMGLAVLTYDKRGIGSSTGRYPGDYPTEDALKVYADDAEAARTFLAHWPGVNPARVGFHGGSQGGWTVPLAILRHPGAAFAVLVSAPATTVEQTDLWAGFTGGGTSAPTEPNDQMLADVRQAGGGYDPAPALRVLTVPSLWVLGSNDRTVPTAVCVEVLGALDISNISVHLVPTGHALLVNPTGLVADDDRSPGLAPDLVPTLRDFIEREVKMG